MGRRAAYLVWLRAKTGKPYRLPTEAEWEYACRAGTETNYPFGDAIGPALANYDRQVGRTQEVGSYPPNPWGLHDMNGNVWEWVEDVYNNGHGGRPEDCQARTSGPDPEDHVIRGGSWDDRDRRARCASRDRKDSAHREDELGLPGGLAANSPRLRFLRDDMALPSAVDPGGTLLPGRGVTDRWVRLRHRGRSHSTEPGPASHPPSLCLTGHGIGHQYRTMPRSRS